jgi:micrococcal nuclease
MKRQVLLAVVLLVLLTACSGSSQPTPTNEWLEPARQTMIAAGEIPAETPTVEPTFSGLPTFTPTFTLVSPSGNLIQPESGISNPGSCVPSDVPIELGLVLDVIDSVSLVVSIDGDEQRVRYIGLEPPGNPAFRPAAADKNFEMTLNQVIMLIKDVSERDRNGHLLRYVFIPDREGIFVNFELVSQGFALAVPESPNTSCQETLRLAEEQARYTLVGLWAPTPIASSPAYRPQATYTVSADSTNCHPSYPSVCIPPPPPYLNCGNVPYRDFTVLPPDPHGLDADWDGIGCEN